MLANTLIPTGMYNLLTGVFPMMILFSIVAITLRFITNVYSHSKFDFYHDLKALVYVLYCFLLFVLVTTNDFTSYSNNFIPFKEILRYKITDPLFIRNILGNILLFVPFSYIVTDVVYMVCKKTNFLICTIYVLLTSLAIESIQYFIGRAFDIDDILLNFIGGILGYLIWKLIHIIFHKNVL